MVYVLDADILIVLFKLVGPTLAAVGRLPVVIPELVWNEVASGRLGGDRAAWMAAMAGAPTTWTVTSAEHQTWLKVSAGVEARLGDGERAVIAYAYVDSSAVAVTADQLALKRAIEHLRGRVLSTFGFLDALVTARHLSPVVLEEFAKKYAASGLGKDHPAPLWVAHA